MAEPAAAASLSINRMGNPDMNRRFDPEKSWQCLYITGLARPVSPGALGSCRVLLTVQDGPLYHPGVCILSLAAPAVMRFSCKRSSDDDTRAQGAFPHPLASREALLGSRSAECCVGKGSRALCYLSYPWCWQRGLTCTCACIEFW